MNKNSGVGRRDAIHFLKQLFQSTTLTYDLLESVLIVDHVVGIESCQSFHRDLLAPPEFAFPLPGLNSFQEYGNGFPAETTQGMCEVLAPLREVIEVAEGERPDPDRLRQ